MRKGLFIGLGGSGIATVARLKAQLFQCTYNYDKSAMDAGCTFIFYDNDEKAIEDIIQNPELQKMMDNCPVIDRNKEYISAREVSPMNAYCVARNADASDANSQRLLEWAIDPTVPGHFQFHSELDHGCTSRMEGRIALYSIKKRFERCIIAGLQKMHETIEEDAQPPEIWVFASSNGGTGSSALLDVLYLVDRWYKTILEDNDPYLRLVLFMPKVYIDKNIDAVKYYACNAYATLWELNEFRNDAVAKKDGNKFGRFAIQPDMPYWNNLLPWSVCKFVIAIDSEDQKGHLIDTAQMYKNAAEICYSMYVSNAFMGIDNPIRYFEPRSSCCEPFEWSPFVVGVGRKSIKKADDFLKEYIRRRFRFDVLDGLFGGTFEEYLPTYNRQKLAVTNFADECILSHLINFDNPILSGESSLYARYKAEFDSIIIPFAEDIGRHFDAHDFMFECRKKKASLEKNLSELKIYYLDTIKKTVLERVEHCIVDYGLEYTFGLLALVDDEYCEQSLVEKFQSLKNKNNIIDIEDDVVDIKVGFWGKNAEYMVAKLEEYKEACLFRAVSDAILSILQDITERPHGLLEKIRHGDSTCKGIRKIANIVKNERESYKNQYLELCKLFAQTKHDISTDFFPNVSKFVTGQDPLVKWRQNHLFEQLYSSIVPLDLTKDLSNVDHVGLGTPPIRYANPLGSLASILDKLKTLNTFSFTDMVMCLVDEKEMLAIFHNNIDRFIEHVMDHCSAVQRWLDMPLRDAFYEAFREKGNVDANKLEAYKYNFMQSISVFYPKKPGVVKEHEDKWLFIGKDADFAMEFGDMYNINNAFFHDNSLGHSMQVYKFEIGLSFYDYKYFDVISAMYKSEKVKIESHGSGCHIHKGFVHRDIESAYQELIK